MPQIEKAALPEPRPTLVSQETYTPASGQQLFNVAAGAAKTGYESAAKQSFEGDASQAKVTLGEEWSPSDIKNLQDLKRAREQNKISATGARLKTAQLVKEMGARWPGMEDTFHRQADTFFGKFGQGDMLLDDTSEKTQRKLYENQFLAPGIQAGIINAADPYNDVQGQQAWKKMIYEKTILKHKLDMVEGDYKVGNSTAVDVGSAYVASDVDSDIAYFLNQQTQRLESGEKTINDQELKAIVSAKIVQQRLALNQKLAGKRVSPETRKQIMDEIDNRWAGVNKMIDSGSFSTWIKGKGEMMRQWGTVFGATKYPEMFALNSAMPGGAAVLLQTAPIFARLKTPEQRENFIKTQPPMTQRILRSLGENPTDVVPMIDNLINGKVTTGVDGVDSVVMGITRDYAGKPATTDDPKEVEQKKKAAEAIMMYDTPKNIMNMATQPGAVPNFYNDKKLLGQLQTTVDHTYAAALPALHNEFVGTKRLGSPRRGLKGQTVPDVNYVVSLKGNEFVFTSAETGESTKKYGRAGSRTVFPDDVKKHIDHLNQINKIVNIYGPVLGIQPDKWRRDTALYIMGGPDAKQQSQGQVVAPPKAGDVIDGYTFKGGDPNDKNNWEK